MDEHQVIWVWYILWAKDSSFTFWLWYFILPSQLASREEIMSSLKSSLGMELRSGNKLMSIRYISVIINIDFVKLIKNTGELCAWPLLNHPG